MPNKTIGRPSTYTKTIGLQICARIAAGESLGQVCQDDKFPGRATVFRWRQKNPEFDQAYLQAREMLYERWADDIIDIADDSSADVVEKTGRNGAVYMAADHDHINRSRLMVESRKWLLSKLLPDTYGDQLAVDHKGKITHDVNLSDRERMRRFVLFMLEDGNTIDGESTPVVAPDAIAKPIPQPFPVDQTTD